MGPGSQERLGKLITTHTAQVAQAGAGISSGWHQSGLKV